MNSAEIMKETLEHIQIYCHDVYVRKLCAETLKLVAQAEADSPEKIARRAAARNLLLNSPQPQ